MGTNYYWRTGNGECPTCGHVDQEDLHIGKSSFGWVFSLHVTPELRTLDDWKEFFKISEGKIVDEYENEISLEGLMKIIMERDAYVAKDDTELRRHFVDGVFCTGHGEGSWDYLSGYFR